MAPRVQYGKTWWGSEWLKALNACDHANRLPRGKTYCNQGNVREVSIDPVTHKVEAIVQGHFAVYEVSIGLRAFTENETQRLIEAIKSEPQLLAQLLDHTLPSEVKRLCDQLGLDLFPSSSLDLELSCSCPDSARLCKHIAAVIYWLSREIDNDPFILFTLHGVNFLEKLSEAGLQVKEATADHPCTLYDLLPAAEAIVTGEKDSHYTLRTLPLTPIDDVGEKIFSLLPKRFALSESRDFPAELLKCLKKNAAYAESLLSPFDDDNSLFTEKILKDVRQYNRHHYVFRLNRENLRDFDFYDEKGKRVASDEAMRLISTLMSLPEAMSREHLKSSLYALRVLFLFTQRLYRARAVIPVTVVSRDDPNPWPVIYWTPAVRLNAAARAVSDFTEAFKGQIDELFGFDGLPLKTEAQKSFMALTLALTFWHRIFSKNASFDGAAALFASPSAADLCAEVKPVLAEHFARYLRVLNLTLNFPWLPQIALRKTRDGALNLHFLIKAKEDRGRPIDLKTLLKSDQYEKERYAALNVVSTLQSLYPVFNDLTNTATKTVKLAASELRDFLFEVSQGLTLLGIAVSMPLSLKKLLKPTLVAQVSSSAGSSSFFTQESLSDFNYQMALGDSALSKDEFEVLVQHAGEVIPWGDQYVYVDPQEIEKYRERLQNAPKYSPLEKVRALLTGEVDGIEVFATDELKKQLQNIEKVKAVKVPQTLKASLRPYQQRGYEWLIKNIRLGLGSLIADDMGLGKTLQVIAALTALKEAGEFKDKKALVVVPTTLLTNWSREIEKFSPALRYCLYHGSERILPPSDTFDVLLTSYGIVRRDIEKLALMPWRFLVIDEAQAVKNHSTTLSQSLSVLKAQQVIAMSGTPVENHLMEYWSIFSIIEPGLLGSESDFKRTFAAPIESERDPKVIDALRALTKPFMLRRLKTDKSIIDDLPEKLLSDQFAPLTIEQAALYQKVLSSALKQMKKVEDAAKEEGSDFKMKKRALVLKLMTSLKQICNSPSQYLKTQTETPDSGKGTLLLELIGRNLEAGRKVLIFTQYREMGLRLQTWIQKAMNLRAPFLHGGVSIKERSRMVDEFQTDPSVQVMILSLKAAGTGLNLTAASAVIHYDLWWNPAVESQATDRAYRIGQKKDVEVYRFVTAGTFEEKINEMLKSKKELADLTVQSGETWIGDLESKQIEEIFKLTH